MAPLGPIISVAAQALLQNGGGNALSGILGGGAMGKSGGGNPLDPLGILPSPSELLKSAPTDLEKLLQQPSPLDLLLGDDSAQSSDPQNQ